MHLLNSLAFVSIIGITFFTKKVSLMNKLTIAGCISYLVFLYLENMKNRDVVDEIALDDSLIGQECRILIKFYLPNHSKILIFDELIDEFKSKKDRIKLNEVKVKENIKEIINQELADEQKFLDELSQLKKNNNL